MKDYKSLIQLIQDKVTAFNKDIPGIQESVYQELQQLLKELETTRGGVKPSVNNLRVITKIKSKLLEIILSKDYVNSVQDYVRGFQAVTDMQHAYFVGIDSKFKPLKLTKEIQKQSIQSVVSSLTESGIEANVLAGIDNILRTNITTGGSYSDLTEQLRNYVTSSGGNDGIIQRYASQITTDALNQYAAQNTQLISNDLGLEWFVYAGSNIETSRPFCLACTQKRFIHISEFPALLDGDFPEFKEFDGKLYKGLPAGMYLDTTVSNFPIKRGGYNCGHQLRPITDMTVPEDKKRMVYSSNAYQTWARAMGIEMPVVSPSGSQKDKIELIRNNNKAEIKKIEEIGTVFHESILAQLPDDIKIFSTNGGAYYHPEKNEIALSVQGDRRRQEYYRNIIVAHEGGHAIHFTKRIITDDYVAPEFLEVHKKLKSLIAGKESKIDNELFQIRTSVKDLNDIEQVAVYADILGSLTKGKFGRGHELSYYTYKNNSMMEIFAHAMALNVMPNKYENVSETLRELTKILRDYAKTVI